MSKGGRCGSNPGGGPPLPIGSNGGLPNGGGGIPNGGGPLGSNGGRPPYGPHGSSKGDRGNGGRKAPGGIPGGAPGGPRWPSNSPLCNSGLVTHACFDTGKSAVQSIGVATTSCASPPSRLSGHKELICRLNFSSTTGTLGGGTLSSSLCAVHSIKFKWHSFCERSVGLPAISSGSGLPGTYTQHKRVSPANGSLLTNSHGFSVSANTRKMLNSLLAPSTEKIATSNSPGAPPLVLVYTGRTRALFDNGGASFPRRVQTLPGSTILKSWADPPSSGSTTRTCGERSCA
mmetsp:Transcript_31665/g.50555  ORF Transcript_31665/g.50555 Transcript_31665/m.50555 type:complete len:288 (+) Transcript_31665:1065-1928(+)